MSPEEGRRALDELAHMPRGTGREPLPPWVLWTVAIGLTVMSLGSLGIGIVALSNRTDIATNRAAVGKADDKTGTVARDLVQTQRCLTVAKRAQRCLERVIGAQGPGGATGATGRAGRRGLAAVAIPGPRGKAGKAGTNGRDAPPLTRERVAEGFSLWCSRMLCVGRDAPPVTRDELAATLLELCGGSCNGTDGRDAPPPTQDQVNAACGAGLCPASTGPPGEPGAQGPQGEQGAPGLPAPAAPCDPALGYVCQPPPPAGAGPP